MTAHSTSRFVCLTAAALALLAFAVFCAAAGGVSSYTFVALGDSYSSGVGTGTYSLDSSCKRSVYAFPYLYAQKHPELSLGFVACSGAKTSDVLSTQIASVTSATDIALARRVRGHRRHRPSQPPSTGSTMPLT